MKQLLLIFACGLSLYDIQLYVNMSLIPIKKLSKNTAKVYLLGIGTVWFGRLWPPDNSSYIYPNPDEISKYLDEVFAQLAGGKGLLMIDTSSSYGFSEEKLDQYFKSQKQLLKQTLIATKWGEEFNTSSGICKLKHSLNQLRSSFERSLIRLGKIDILYIHRTNNKVLNDKAVIDEMKKLKKDAKLKLIGASFSNEKTLEEALGKNLISWCNIIQIPAAVFLKRPDLIRKIKQNDTSIVVNSPIRKGENKPTEKIYQELISHPEITVILTGTRNHLKETVSYFSSSKSK